jgi:hypothetical protein
MNDAIQMLFSLFKSKTPVKKVTLTPVVKEVTPVTPVMEVTLEVTPEVTPVEKLVPPPQPVAVVVAPSETPAVETPAVVTEGILSDATITKIKATTTRRKSKRDANNAAAYAVRRKQRVEEKEILDATPDAFWQRNISVANQTRLAELLEQQERVFDQLHWMDAQVNGTYDVDPNDATVYVGVEEGAADVAADVATNGICQMEVLLVEFWRTPAVFAQLTQRENATATFARLGIITAIPDHRLHAWQTWLASRRPNESQSSGWTTLQCACGERPSAVPKEIAERYQQLQKVFLCERCIAGEKNSRSQATIETRLGGW